jgi:hypothetical protein
MIGSALEQCPIGDAVKCHLAAYNAAFYELGLSWHWDDETFHSLQRMSCERDRIKDYMHSHQSHLLKVYDADFLIDAIQTTKARCFETMTDGGAKKAPTVNWAEFQRAEVGA